MAEQITSLDRLALLRQRAASSAEALSDNDRRTDPLRQRATRSLNALSTPNLVRLASRLEA